MVSSPLLAAPKLNQVTLEDGPAQPESSEPTITFAFKEATFEQVVDFFGRAAGLPVVWEAAPPAGTLRYQSDRTYGIDDGLQVLNTILQAKGVMLRRREDMLYLQPLAEMAKRDVPTFVGSLPDTVTDDEVVTLVLPLRIASANALVEQLRGLVAGYGSVSALPQQNALVIVETAAQVRRLAGMVASFDAQDTDGIVRIIKLEHVGAEAIMGPLRSLLAVRVEKYVVDAKGKQVKVEDEQIPGITFSPDARTNSLIVKGNERKSQSLKKRFGFWMFPRTEARGDAPSLWKTAGPKTSSGRWVRSSTNCPRTSVRSCFPSPRQIVCLPREMMRFWRNWLVSSLNTTGAMSRCPKTMEHPRLKWSRWMPCGLPTSCPRFEGCSPSVSSKCCGWWQDPKIER